MSFSYYGELCTEVYDLTKSIGQSFNGDIQYYQERLKSVRGPILEAMVGSGRVLIPLLESGLLVDGVDYSHEMLSSCQQRCEARGLKTNLYHADLKDLALPGKYEAIIVPAGSFLLIENREEAIEVLKRFYDHLEVGGRLILDLFLPDNDYNSSDLGKWSASAINHLPNGVTVSSFKRNCSVLHCGGMGWKNLSACWKT